MARTTEDGYSRTNRELRREPHKVRIWCGACDRYRVGIGGRCRVCGAREPSKRDRKIVVKD
jgi:hypothetical protein